CFRFSVSSGTDLPAALYTVLGFWGVAAGNGALAAAGLALAAQTRLELIALVPLVWLAKTIETRWKVAALGLVLAEMVHVGWVLWAAPSFAAFERVPSTFALGNAVSNLIGSLTYLLNPFQVPILLPVLCVLAIIRKRNLQFVTW